MCKFAFEKYSNFFMAGVNKVILLGNLGQKPETRYVSAELSVSRLSVATTEVATNHKGERVSQTEWHTVVLWRQLSRFAEQYLRKGDTVYIEGRLKSRYIEQGEGLRRKVTEVIADRIDLLAHHDAPKQPETEKEPDDDSPGSGLPGIDLENIPADIPSGGTLPF